MARLGQSVRLMVLFSLLLGSSIASAAGTKFPEKVLFVGNSFTYYNDGLHMHYGNLLRAAGLYQAQRSNLRMMTFSGSGLWEHEAALQSALTNDPWQAVIMHDYSNGPITRWDRFAAATDALSRIARDHSAEPILFMTWAYADQPEMTLALAEAYVRRGQELGTRVIPVGLAFAAATRELADMSVDLYSPDIETFENGQPVFKETVKHPSLAGTYLAACTVFTVLTGRSPEGLIYTAGLDAQLAAALQRVAHRTVQDFQES